MMVNGSISLGCSVTGFLSASLGSVTFLIIIIIITIITYIYNALNDALSECRNLSPYC